MNKWLNVRFGISKIDVGTMISRTYMLMIILVPIMGVIGDKKEKWRVKMIGLHLVCFSMFLGILTFYPNCGEDSPCKIPVTIALFLYALSFSL